MSENHFLLLETIAAGLKMLRMEDGESQEAITERFKYDPLGFVMYEWPWRKPGPLQTLTGPDALQRQFLIDLAGHVKARNFDGHTPVRPVRMAIASAHGTGKSTLGAWITWWILRTRPGSVGTVSAGTYQQLQERTWADITYWGNLAKGGKQFHIRKSGIYHRSSRGDKWKVTPKTAKAENAQSFAGQHAGTATSFFLFDEASEIPDQNWATAYGGLTDGEPMFFAWGQPLRNTGEFNNVTFGRASARWDSRVWNGRHSAFTSKDLINEWLEEYGEDSDFYRVRVLGLPPNASELQFIGAALVDGARRRDHKALPDEPLVVGLDCANGGMAKYCFWFRRGLDGKSIPPIFLRGDTPRDQVVAVAAKLLLDRNQRVAAMFVDQAFGAVIVAKLQASGFSNAFEVNFGDSSPDKHYLNMRAYMWASMKEWLNLGSIPDDDNIAMPFFAPGFHLNQSGKLVIESKQEMAKRKVKSPDGPDALALTFARKVAAPPTQSHIPQNPYRGSGDSMSWVR